MGRVAGILGLLLLTSAGCHLVFPHQPRSDGAAPDLRSDGPTSEQLVALDLRRDSHSSPITCTTPALVGKSAPVNLYEVALRSDGLELVANAGKLIWYSSLRATPTGSFGAWSQSSKITSWLAGKEDPTFFRVDDAEHAIVAYTPDGVVPRVLELCSFGPLTCSPLAILDATGTAITKDLDGPSVAILPNGKLLMAHNLGVDNSDGLLYLAAPTDPSVLTAPWSTMPLPSLDRIESREDDPALSPDGLVIVFEGKTSSSSDDDLWVSRRAGVEEPFPAPVPVPEVNSGTNDGSPCLALLPTPDGQPRYELFFTSDRDETGRKIYRSECR